MLNKLQHILAGSKQYQFDGPILTITNYYTGEEIKLDLSRLDEEVLNELIVQDDEFEDDYFEE